jgi:glycerophosphoryl diester phosphodiesterase
MPRDPRARASRPPRLYAHRGAAAELPENTLPAFRLALELGADALETDAHLTLDGHVVLSHDATGERMCGIPKPIEHSTVDEVRSWDAGAKFVPSGRAGSAGSGAPGDGAHAGATFRIPTLEEALRELPGVRFNVDAKSRHPDMVGRLLDVVNRAQATDRTLIASFHADTLRKVRRSGYRGETGLAQSEVVRLLALPPRALAWLPLRGSAAQLPYRIYGVDLGTRAVVDKCHALGLDVHYWTVNEPALANRLLDVGADAIMTDDPRAIAPVLDAWRRRQ